MTLLVEFVERNLHIAARSGNEYMCKCIFHDDTNASMQVNVEKGLFLCFACGERGTAKKLSRQLGVRYEEGAIGVADIKAKLERLRNPSPRCAVLGEEYLDRYQFTTDYWGRCPTRRVPGCTSRQGCKLHRWLDPATVDAFDLGYDPIGGYVTIPVRTQYGGLLGVIRRFLAPDSELRYRYPKGFQRSSNLFGSWMVEHDEDTDTVVLVEGPIDAMHVWQAGHSSVGCYGNSINPAQIRVLKRLGVSQVTVFADNDHGGRQFVERAQGWHVKRDRAGRVLHRQYRPETDLTRDFLVRVVDWRGVQAKDPGELTEHQVHSMLRTAHKVF